MALLSDEERKQIETKIAELELRTAGEVVVATVSKSVDYGQRRAWHAVVLGIIAAALVHRALPDLATDWILLSLLPLIGLLYALFSVPAVVRWITPAEQRRAAAQARASQMFTERSVFDTRDHSGVLIFISELEHQVVMLGDRGIHARLQVEGWQRHVDHIIAAIREGRPGAGVCEVLNELDEVLHEAFPRRPDDENELPNSVVQE